MRIETITQYNFCPLDLTTAKSLLLTLRKKNSFSRSVIAVPIKIEMPGLLSSLLSTSLSDEVCTFFPSRKFSSFAQAEGDEALDDGQDKEEPKFCERVSSAAAVTVSKPNSSYELPNISDPFFADTTNLFKDKNKLRKPTPDEPDEGKTFIRDSIILISSCALLTYSFFNN